MPNRNRGNNNRGRNNNPEGRNQYSSAFSWDSARERPLATAAAIGGAVAAGVFLWSRRNQISDQLSNLSEQIGEWREGIGTGSEDSELEMAGGGDFSASAGMTSAGSSTTGGSRSGGSRSGRGTTARGSARGLSETGGGNASLGAHSGGSGIGSSPTGRGRS